jgi:hypothetical protein
MNKNTDIQEVEVVDRFEVYQQLAIMKIFKIEDSSEEGSLKPGLEENRRSPGTSSLRGVLR